MEIIQKIAVGLTTLLLSFLTYFSEENTKNYSIDTIDNIVSPQQILQLSERELIFVVGEDIFNYDIDRKESEVIAQRKPNEFIAIQNGKLLFCSFEHYNISSIDEFSTKFSLYDSKHELIKEFLFFETIRPVQISNNKIIAVTAVDFLQQHRYEIDIETGEKEEIFTIDRDQETSEYDIEKPDDLDIKDIEKLNDREYIIIDIFGNTYYCRRNEELSQSLFKNFVTFLSTLIPSKAL